MRPSNYSESKGEDCSVFSGGCAGAGIKAGKITGQRAIGETDGEIQNFMVPMACLCPVCVYFYRELCFSFSLLWLPSFYQSLFCFLPGAALGKLDAVLWAQPACGKGKKGRMGIQLSNKSLLPLDRIVCTVEGSNLLTGQGFRRSVRMAAVPGGESVQDLEIISPCCGMLSFSAVGITVYDLFGLGRFRKKILAEARMAVQPDTFGVEVEVAYGESMSLDGEEYSMKKSGFDPSETFAIRDYREGDRIRQIHWELSGKNGGSAGSGVWTSHTEYHSSSAGNGNYGRGGKKGMGRQDGYAG